MEEEYTIVYDDHPEEVAWGVIGRGISRYNRQKAGEYRFIRPCFVLLSPDKEIVGGALGELYWNWLHLELLWVKEDLRGRGFGERLLMTIEEDARSRGAKHVFLDTFSFQAPDFYRQRGYRLFGELNDFPPGHQRLFMVKEL